jgi:hypothetical protein
LFERCVSVILFHFKISSKVRGRFSVCAVKLAEIKRRMSSDKKFFIALKLLVLPIYMKSACKKTRFLHEVMKIKIFPVEQE